LWIAIDAAALFVYVVNSTGNSVSQYAIGADGGLTPLTTPTVATGLKPYAIAVVN
jgi:hypothetical protein